MKGNFYPVFAILLILSGSVLWFSCNETEDATDSTRASNVVTWDTDPAFFTDSMIETPCAFIPAMYTEDDPHTTIKYPAFVLQPGIYHGDEVTEEMKNADWYSILKGENETILEGNEVTFAPAYDMVLDEDTNMKTGIEVSGKIEKEVLIANVGKLYKSTLIPVSLDTNVILPGKSYYFEYGGVYYRMYATAYRYKERGEGQYSIRNYKLFLEQQENGKMTKQLLVARPYLDDAYYTAHVFFAGDIDADGKPDLVLNVPMYNGLNTILYLSGKAEQGKLLKVMAVHLSVGC